MQTVVAPRVVVSDVDGVVRHFDAARQADIESRHGLPLGAILAVAFEPRLLLPAITGAVSDEAWRASVAASLRRCFPATDAASAVAEWSASAGAADEQVVNVLRHVRRRVPVLALTNATTRLAADLARSGLDGVFDRVVSSTQIGHAKPSARAFHAAHAIASEVCGLGGLAPEDVLFFDDNAEHVAAAVSFGWSAARFTGSHSLAETCRAAGLTLP